MHDVKPLTALSREEIRELARNAADNEVPLPVADVFPKGSEESSHFTLAYWERDAQLRGCEA